jgi:hypothetical protein
MEDEKLDDASSKKADSSAALRNDNRMELATAKANANAGILRYAQNDNF